MLSQVNYEAILNSLKEPLAFVDTDHIIRWMNSAALQWYATSKSTPDGDSRNLIGRHLFECHNLKVSNKMTIENLERIKAGEEEVFVTICEGRPGEYKKTFGRKNVFQRGVRDEFGKVIGYYVRYEPTDMEPTGNLKEENDPSKE